LHPLPQAVRVNRAGRRASAPRPRGLWNVPENVGWREQAPRTGGRKKLAALAAALALAVGVPLGIMGLGTAQGRLPDQRRASNAGPAASSAASSAAPRRIVSTDPCLDAILVHVADPGQIAALSHYSHNPRTSTVAELARRFPYTYATAEEVLALKPDLVLASMHTAPATRNALERMGIPLATFPVPSTVAESLAQVREVARIIGHPEQGEALARRIEAALDAIPASGPPIPTLIFQHDGFSPGAGTLQNDLLRRAGLVNEAARYGVGFWGVVPLERLVADPPRLLLTSRLETGNPAVQDRVLEHPVLRRLKGRMVRAYYPPQLLYCGGPSLIDAARYLTAARLAVEKAS